MKEMALFKITTPIEIPFAENGGKITLYKNNDNFFVAIVKGQEIGLASAFDSNLAKEELPSCIDGVIIDVLSNEILMKALLDIKTPSHNG